MPKITKTQNRTLKAADRITWILFALVVVAIYFFALDMPLIGPDEPRYAQVAREMFERGDWITPTLGGFDWFEKPALLYWLQIGAYKIFGVSESAARFGPALFGLGTIFSLWILGRNYPQINIDEHRLENQELKIKDQNSNTDFANWLALIVVSSIGLITFSRGASFDIILTFPITASLVGFFIFDQSKTKSFTTYHLPLFTFYFSIGVALLAKGLVGIVFPLAIVAFYHLLSRKLPSKMFVFSLFWGTLLSLIVAAAWYLPMYQANGWKFIDEFFVQHHFQRYTSNKYLHPQPFWFFFAVLPLMALPWLPFFAASIWDFIKVQSSNFKVRSSEQLSTFSSQLSIFAAAWLLVPLVFFSLSGSKLPGYVLPALPAALILTAQYVYRFVHGSRRREIFIKSVALVTFAIVAVALRFFVIDYVRHESVKDLIEAADVRGHADEKIVNLYTVSHNLEFYAADRLVREADGKQKRYDDFSVLVRDLKMQPDGTILALVPQKDLPNLIKENLAEIEVLGENGESALILLKSK